MSLARILIALYRKRGRQVLAVMALAITTIAAGIALLGVSGWFLSGAALASSLLAFNLFVPSSLIRAFSFVRIGARYAERVVGHATTLRLLSDLRLQVFTSILQQSPRQLAQLRQGETVSGLTADIDALDAVFLMLVVPVCVALLAGLVFGGVWLSVAPWAAFAVGVSTVIVAVLLPVWLARRAYAQGRKAQHAWTRAREEVLALVQGHADVVALGATSHARMRFDAIVQEASAARLGQSNAAAFGQAAVQAVASLCTLAALICGIVAWQNGHIGGPLLAGLVLATLGFFEVAAPIMRGATRLGAASAAAERIDAMLATRADVLDVTAPLSLPEQGEIRLVDVGFAYGSGSRVFDGITLAVRAGEKLALIGPSGCGKSTLLHLMMRLHDPDMGRITFAGCDVRTSASAALHKRMALLSQDAPVFLGTVRTNLLIGKPDASDDQLWRALDQARLGDHVRGLEQGLDTWTGETGWSLSAGQARRLCLARVMLTDAQVWLLDEPTAGLDAANERAFFEALAQCAGNRTVVVATHATMPTMSFDRVYNVSDRSFA